MSAEGGSDPGTGSPPAGRRIRDALRSFLRDDGPRIALVVERGGSIVSAAGNPRDTDPVALASIATAHFNATEQLASTLGEGEFTSLLHQGEATSVYLVDVAGVAILVALFDERCNAERVAREGATMVAQLEGPVGQLLEGKGTDGKGISMEWVRAAEAEIERIFRERA